MLHCCKSIPFQKHPLLWLVLYSEQWESKIIAHITTKLETMLNCLLSAELRLSAVDRLGFVSSAVDGSSLWAVRAIAMKTTKTRFMRKNEILSEFKSFAWIFNLHWDYFRQCFFRRVLRSFLVNPRTINYTTMVDFEAHLSSIWWK